MIKLTLKYQTILNIFLRKNTMSSSIVYAELIKSGETVSLVTIKRTLSDMAKIGLLTTMGAGRALNYTITPLGRILTDIDAKQYVTIEPDQRYGLNKYNFDLWPNLSANIFTEEELKKLENATKEYRQRTQNLSPVIQQKELQRLVIELSWKSSKIEGNTYTLLDTEKLILENKEALGHDKMEARMILNHKDAFNYIYNNAEQFKTVTQRNLEELHAILVKDLSINKGFRAKPVGITGSKYLPLDNIHQITEAVRNLSNAISDMDILYAKSLIALLGISYIQPFEDGNKRTARLMADGILLAHSLSPLSYRSINEEDYRAGMVVFYELNSIAPMKKIFIEQYIFAAKNYAVK